MNWKSVYPGHGPAGGADLIDSTKAYIDDFVAAAEQAGNPAEPVQAMQTKYPTSRCGYCLELAAQARFEP